MKRIILAAALAAWALTGCASLLERSYSTAEPHSSKFWESEAAGTLRAESHQDIVNDILLLVGQHTESATLRLYNYEDDLAAADALDSATVEIQQETPLGSYAVAYITFENQAQRGYYESKIQIGYRRTAEQLSAVVNATSPMAVYSLLGAALDADRTELAVRLGYWGPSGEEQVRDAVAQLRDDRQLAKTPVWYCYPPEGPVGLIEFDLDPPDPPEPELAPILDGEGKPLLDESGQPVVPTAEAVLDEAGNPVLDENGQARTRLVAPALGEDGKPALDENGQPLLREVEIATDENGNPLRNEAGQILVRPVEAAETPPEA